MEYIAFEFDRAIVWAIGFWLTSAVGVLVKKKLSKLFFIALLFSVVPAFATPSGYGTCTKATTVTTSSTAVLARDDVPAGRSYMMIQNTGSNPVYCALGTSNVATATNGFLLPASGGSWMMQSTYTVNGVMLKAPNDDLACIATGGSSTVISCDY